MSGGAFLQRRGCDPCFTHLKHRAAMTAEVPPKLPAWYCETGIGAQNLLAQFLRHTDSSTTKFLVMDDIEPTN